VPVRSTEEMRRAVLERSEKAKVIIMAAAVADFRPAAAQPAKIKRGDGGATIALEPTPDILVELTREKGSRIIVGFAAETGHMAENARAKLERKGADMIVANDVTQEGAGFDTDTNIVTMYLRGGSEIALAKMSKFDVGNRVLDQVLEIQKQSK
jgi:phosphopantothenoylcysteine decarboxylase/phosphopantothenate--cysteine ligase